MRQRIYHFLLLHLFLLNQPQKSFSFRTISFLPCALAGLSNAPQYATPYGSFVNGYVVADDVDSVVLPADACSGDATLAFARSKRSNKPLIITVEENQTVLDDRPDKLGIKVIKVQNYWETIGVIAGHKAGVDPKSLRKDAIDNIHNPSQLYSPIRDLSTNGNGHYKVCSYYV